METRLIPVGWRFSHGMATRAPYDLQCPGTNPHGGRRIENKTLRLPSRGVSNCKAASLNASRLLASAPGFAPNSSLSSCMDGMKVTVTIKPEGSLWQGSHKLQSLRHTNFSQTHSLSLRLCRISITFYANTIINNHNKSHICKSPVYMQHL